MKILNVGCGNEKYGTERIDFIKTESTTKVYDIENGLPYESNSFDEVYSNHVLEHMKNPFNLILEMERVCAITGKIIIETDNAGYFLFHILRYKRKNGKRVLKNNYHGNHTGTSKEDRHYLLFTKEHLRNLFEAADIKVESIVLKDDSNINSSKSNFYHWILGLFFSERFTKSSVKIIGEKIK